jgi:4-amino-4-deoxy-L-arabinose transferase-like glycosyltransferase
MGAGGAGGFLSISTPGSKLAKALESNASRYTWVAATVNSNSAAGYQLATDDPVMAIGGFNGTDPAPTLAQFERDVADKKIHYFISGGGGLGTGSSGSTAGQITQWVESHFTAETLNGTTVYDLTG